MYSPCKTHAATQPPHYRFLLLVKMCLRTLRIVVYTVLPLCTLNCIVPADSGQTPLLMSLVSTTDTIAPYGEIAIAFTSPVNDSPLVNFLFSPPFHSFYTTHNSTSDTFTITLTGPLYGNTRFTIRTSSVVSSKNGLHRSAEEDSLEWYTFLREKEPNDNPATADTLSTYLYGSVETIHDTDCYILTTAVPAVYHESYDSPTLLRIDGTQEPLLDTAEHKKTDTLLIPKSTPFPVVLRVSSRQKSSGGYYKLSVKKK